MQSYEILLNRFWQGKIHPRRNKGWKSASCLDCSVVQDTWAGERLWQHTWTVNLTVAISPEGPQTNCVNHNSQVRNINIIRKYKGSKKYSLKALQSLQFLT